MTKVGVAILNIMRGIGTFLFVFVEISLAAEAQDPSLVQCHVTPNKLSGNCGLGSILQYSTKLPTSGTVPYSAAIKKSR